MSGGPASGRSHRLGWLLPLLLLAAAPSSRANDSAAALSGGGLRFTRNAAIALDSEALTINPNRVSVEYRFRNLTGRPVSIRIAFPLPRISMATWLQGFPDVDLPDEAPRNFVGFETRIDGRPVSTQTVTRAFVRGRDVTRDLKAARIPLTHDTEAVEAALQRLRPAETRRLRAGGVLDDYSWPAWELEIVYHWQQRFAPRAVTRIDHTYQPVAGGFFVLPGDQPLAGAPGARHPPDQPHLAEFCIDDALWASVELSRETYVREVAYTLRTARNWRGPIGRFDLAIQAEPAYPVAAACLGGLRRVSPGRLELQRRDYRPRDDLRVLFFPDALTQDDERP